jgi:hypothetical protein
MDMKKQWLAGAAALALMSGAAFAQTVTETTRSTTVVPVPPPVESTTTRTEKNSFGGASIEKQQSYQTGPNGTVSSTESKVVRPDGSSETSYRKDWSTGTALPPPAPVAPYSSTTTTTTTR